MLYSVAGRTILIEADDNWSPSAVEHLFSRWFLTALPEQASSKADAILRIRCGITPPSVPSGLNSFEITHGGTCITDSQVYYVKFHDSLIVFGPGTTPEVDLWIQQPYNWSFDTVSQVLSHALSPALRRCGIFEIHSAGVISPYGDRTVMIAGPSGCGKSTLTSQLAQCGWGYLSDDILLLLDRGQKIEAQAFRRFFALTADTIAAMNLSGVVMSKGEGALKEKVVPQDHFESTPIQKAIPGTIVFPTITRHTDSRIIPLTRSDAMTRLLRLCPWSSYDKPTSAGHLRLLGLLANTTSAFDLFAGTDILHDPKSAAEILYTAIPQTALAR